MKYRWIKLERESDLILLPRNEFDNSISVCVLVSSTKRNFNEVFMMYFDFPDRYFHFPLYDKTWIDLTYSPC